MKQTSSRIGEEQELALETEPRDWKHRDYDDEDQEDAEFNDAESIQLETYNEQTVLSIRRMGGTISNEKYDTLLHIRRGLNESKESENISTLRRELRNLSWELDKMGSETCHILMRLDDWAD